MKQVGGYRLLRELPRGPAGRLFVASNARPAHPDEEFVVVRLIDPDLVRDAHYMTILMAEAPAATRFRHDVAANIIEVNRLGDEVAIVTELIDGRPLDEFLDRVHEKSTRLPWEAITWLGAEVAGLLQIAHATPWADGETKGMFHGHLCPQDVYVTYQGAVRLQGIGLGRSRAWLPRSPDRLPYHPPELFERRQTADPLSDIYGLGIVMHACLSGRVAYARATEAAVRRAVLTGTPPPLHLDCPSLPANLEAVVSSMLAKHPAERPSSLFDLERRFRGQLHEPPERYREMFRDMMTLLFRSSSSPPLSMPAPAPIDWQEAPPLHPTGAHRAVRRPGPESSLVSDDLGVDELADVIVAQRVRQQDAVADATRARRVSPPETTPLPGEHPESESPVPSRLPPPLAIDEIPRIPSFRALTEGSDDDLDDLVNAIVSHSRRGPDGPGLSGRAGDPPFEIEPTAHVESAVPGAPPPSSSLPSASALGYPPPQVPTTAGPLLRAGDVVGDRYRVVSVLGEGGVSVVYRAEHMLLWKHVALKLMRPEISVLPTAVERFHLEARSVCQLDHPNIVRVTDFGRGADGRLYLVMELVEGESLQDLMSRENRLSPGLALTITSHVLRGLRHAHDKGVIHRDLKPDNIVMTTRDGELIPKILDFGIAKITDERQGERPITQAGTIFGTPRFMSPEQAAGEPVDGRSDLYAVGVVLYRLLSGRLPFEGSTTVQVLSRVLTQPPPPMGLAEPTREAGRDLEAIVQRALEKEAANRFQSCAAFLAAIQEIADAHDLLRDRPDAIAL